MRVGPLPPQINVGIFLCKDVNEQRLKTLVDNLLANDRVARILIRPHPKNLWRSLDSWIAARNDARLCQSFKSTVTEDLKGLDVVFGGNSKPGWSETLKTFANIDEDEATVLSKTRKVIEDLLKL